MVLMVKKIFNNVENNVKQMKEANIETATASPANDPGCGLFG